MHVGFVLARVSALSNKSNSFFCFVLLFYFGLYFLVVGCPKLLDLLHAQSCFGAIFFCFCFCVNSSQHTHTHTQFLSCSLLFRFRVGIRSSFVIPFWSFLFIICWDSRDETQIRNEARLPSATFNQFFSFSLFNFWCRIALRNKWNVKEMQYFSKQNKTKQKTVK